MFPAKLTTVFLDTRLWKTKHPQKRFQNFRQSCALLTDRIEIHQLQPLVWPSNLPFTSCYRAVIDGFRSDMSITRKTDGSFGNVSASVLFSKVAYQRKRWLSPEVTSQLFPVTCFWSRGFVPQRKWNFTFWYIKTRGRKIAIEDKDSFIEVHEIISKLKSQ